MDFNSGYNGGTSFFDRIDDRVRVLSAFSYLVTISFLHSPFQLAAAGILPLLLWINLPGCIFQPLRRLNIMGAIMAVIMAFSWPGEPFLPGMTREGVIAGVVISVRLNFAASVMIAQVTSLGVPRLNDTLSALGLGEKMRILILMTLRGVFILHDRAEHSLSAMRLRAPSPSFSFSLNAYASIIASTLIQSAAASERMLQAIRCRGGMAGFSQFKKKQCGVGEICFVFFYIVYIVLIFMI